MRLKGSVGGWWEAGKFFQSAGAQAEGEKTVGKSEDIKVWAIHWLVVYDLS